MGAGPKRAAANGCFCSPSPPAPPQQRERELLSRASSHPFIHHGGEAQDPVRGPRLPGHHQRGGRLSGRGQRHQVGRDGGAKTAGRNRALRGAATHRPTEEAPVMQPASVRTPPARPPPGESQGSGLLVPARARQSCSRIVKGFIGSNQPLALGTEASTAQRSSSSIAQGTALQSANLEVATKAARLSSP